MWQQLVVQHIPTGVAPPRASIVLGEGAMGT
jgi:hypothetical protein